jgi:hypothetical protein
LGVVHQRWRVVSKDPKAQLAARLIFPIFRNVITEDVEVRELVNFLNVISPELHLGFGTCEARRAATALKGCRWHWVRDGLRVWNQYTLDVRSAIFAG